MDQYEARVTCEIEQGGGDVDAIFTMRVSNQAVLEFLGAIYPAISERIDSIREIRLTVTIMER